MLMLEVAHGAVVQDPQSFAKEDGEMNMGQEMPEKSSCNAAISYGVCAWWRGAYT